MSKGSAWDDIIELSEEHSKLTIKNKDLRREILDLKVELKHLRKLAKELAKAPAEATRLKAQRPLRPI